MSSLRGALAIPWLSLETSREKCATEWKSQHSQASQIAIESIYSTLVKTPNQALIMRESEREKVLLEQYLEAYTRRINSCFYSPLKWSWLSAVACVLQPFDEVLAILWMTVVGQVWGCFICRRTGKGALNNRFTWNVQPCATDRELNTGRKERKWEPPIK